MKNNKQRLLPIFALMRPYRTARGLEMSGVLWLFLFAFTVGAQAQTAPTQVFAEYLTYSDGFNLGIIADIETDQHGMIWAAGSRGLVRFTGATFNYYFKADSVHRNGLGDGGFLAIQKEKSGKLWVSGPSGIYNFYEPKDSFCLIAPPDGGAWKSSSRIILSDTLQNALWMADDAGLFCYSLTQKSWTKTPVTRLESPSSLLLSQRRELYVLSSKSDVFPVYDIKQNRILRELSSKTALYEAKDGIIWMGTWRQGLYRYDPGEQSGQSYFPPGEYNPGVYGEIFTCITTMPSLTGPDILWCGTMDNGIWFFDTRTRQFLHNLNCDDRRISGLPDFYVGAMHTDPNGVVWIGQNGMTRISPFRQQLKPEKYYGLKPDDGRDVALRHILPDRYRPGYQWLAASYYGLISYNSRENRPEKWWFYPNGKPFLKRERNFFCDMVYDKKGNLWASTEQGFMVIDAKNRAKTIDIPKINNGQTAVNVFCFDEQNTLWMASDSGLYAYFSETRRLQAYPRAGGKNANIITDMKAKNGGLWLSTAQGLAFFDLKTGQFENFTVQNAANNAELANRFCCIYVDDATGVIWALNNRALARLEGQAVKEVLSLPHLKFAHTRCLVSDSEGYLWIKGIGSLVKVHPKTLETSEFDCSGFGFTQGENGQLIVPDFSQFTAFFPQNLRQYATSCAPVFTGMKVHDQPFFVDFNASKTQPICLKWSQNAATFEFDCPDFTSGSHTTYAVMLEGYDVHWIAQGNKRNTTYTNLEPGNYTFRVRATNMAGYTHPEDAFLRLEVLPPFWRTWWFRTLALLLAGSGIYAYFQSKLAAVRRDEARKTEFYRFKAETEMRALRAQMNPHFIFNCMNTIEAFIIEHKEEEATAFLQKFSKLIRAVLENAQHDFVSLAKELDILDWYIQLEQIRANNRWSFAQAVDPTLLAQEIQVPPLILQPFVENAILHGLHHRKQKGGHLIIKIGKTPDGHLDCIIEDNGIGRSSAASKQKHVNGKKKSLGVQFSTDRVRKLNPPGQQLFDVITTDVSPENEGLTGTRVRIILPAK